METINKWEFRMLCSKDMFPLFNIINKIGINEFKECFQSEAVQKAAKLKGKADMNALGLNIMLDIGGVIIGNLPACEDDIYKLLADVSNLSINEIQNLLMAEFMEMIIDFVKKPDFADFFKVVSKLFK